MHQKAQVQNAKVCIYHKTNSISEAEVEFNESELVRKIFGNNRGIMCTYLIEIKPPTSQVSLV